MDNLLSIFRSNAGKFRERLAKVKADLERARRRREDLRVLPLPPAEIAALLGEALDKRAARYEQKLRSRVAGLVSDPLASSDSPGMQASMMLLSNDLAVSGQEIEGALCLLFRAELHASIARMVAQTSEKAGPGRVPRTAELDQLEKEIAKLEAAERDMVAELDAIRNEAQP